MIVVDIQRRIQGVVRREVIDNVGQLHNTPIRQALMILN